MGLNSTQPIPQCINAVVQALPGAVPESSAAPISRRYPATKDQNRAITATAMMAVPNHPVATSHDLALKRPIRLSLDTITIIIAMIGIATIPLSTALQTSM